jgi:ABC-2 type transport system ATP-binding protein
MGEAILITENLTRRYKQNYAVNQLNLEVEKGEIYGFLGPNGAGKTTTLRMILGLIKPTEGSVKVFGKSLKEDRISILSRIGAIIENPNYYGHLSGYVNLEISRRLYGVANMNRIDEVLEMLDLDQAKHTKVKHYSLGMKQRLGIAQSLLHKPDLLILDEPTNGLDPEGIHDIRKMLKKLSAEEGVTVILSSHLLGEIASIADRIGIIHQGKLLYQGRIDNLQDEFSAKTTLSVAQPDKAFDILHAKGIKAELDRDTNHLVISDLEDGKLTVIQKTLIDEGIAIQEVRNGQSLEEIFLTMTRKDAGKS